MFETRVSTIGARRLVTIEDGRSARHVKSPVPITPEGFAAEMEHLHFNARGTDKQAVIDLYQGPSSSSRAGGLIRLTNSFKERWALLDGRFHVKVFLHADLEPHSTGLDFLVVTSEFPASSRSTKASSIFLRTIFGHFLLV